MSTSQWQNQTKDKPLFPDLLWSRPERQDLAGMLLIVGGSTHGFVTVVKAMEDAKAAGIGEVKSVLPEGVEKLLGQNPNFLYAKQTPAGSFSQHAAHEVKGYLTAAQGLLLPGDLTKNAETTIFAESVIHTARIPTVLAGEALDVLGSTLGRHGDSRLVVVATFRQLQTLLRASPLAEALLSRTTLDQRVKIIRQFISKAGIDILTLHNQQQFLVVGEEQASLTKNKMSTQTFVAKAAVLCTQFPSRLFEATTTAGII